MLNRRQLVLVMVVAVPLPLVGFGVYWALARPGMLLENFTRLRFEMTDRECEEILGPDLKTYDAWEYGARQMQWKDDSGCVKLVFRREDVSRLWCASFEDASGNEHGLGRLIETPGDKVRRWLNDWTGW